MGFLHSRALKFKVWKGRDPAAKEHVIDMSRNSPYDGTLKSTTLGAPEIRPEMILGVIRVCSPRIARSLLQRSGVFVLG